MSRILELYSELLESKQRFLDEVFEQEIYRRACPQLTIVDLGAYEGEFSFYCLNFAKRIYAFEPDPRPYKVLEERVKKYELGGIIKIYPMAVSVTDGERVLYASGAGGSRLIAEDDTDHSGDKKIKVKSVSLKTFLERNKIDKVGILKIDVEGVEDEIFQSEAFKEIAPRIETIIGEDHQDSLGPSLRASGFEYDNYGDHIFPARTEHR